MEAGHPHDPAGSPPHLSLGRGRGGAPRAPGSPSRALHTHRPHSRLAQDLSRPPGQVALVLPPRWVSSFRAVRGTLRCPIIYTQMAGRWRRGQGGLQCDLHPHPPTHSSAGDPTVTRSTSSPRSAGRKPGNVWMGARSSSARGPGRGPPWSHQDGSLLLHRGRQGRDREAHRKLRAVGFKDTPSGGSLTSRWEPTAASPSGPGLPAPVIAAGWPAVVWHREFAGRFRPLPGVGGEW